MANDIQTVRTLLSSACPKLFEHANVVATGVGYKVTAGQRTATLSIICSVREKRPVSTLAQGDRIPSTVDGIATDVIQTGVLRAWQSHTSRRRPAASASDTKTSLRVPSDAWSKRTASE